MFKNLLVYLSLSLPLFLDCDYNFIQDYVLIYRILNHKELTHHVLFIDVHVHEHELDSRVDHSDQFGTEK